MIRPITQEQTLALRSAVLRNHMALSDCVFPTDELEGVFHLGYFVEDKLVCIATFYPADYPGYAKGGFKLRGMATDAAFSGKGFGSALIKFAIKELTCHQASYLWCNARKTAVGFYIKLGFETISAEYDTPGIGPHVDMLTKL